MNKTEVSSKDLCLLCGEFMGNLKKSSNEVTDFTKSTIECILGSLISPDIQQLHDSFICQNCFIKLNELDEHQMIADKIKSDIIYVYNSINRLDSIYTEVIVKVETVDVLVEEDEDEEELKWSEDVYKKPKKRKSQNSPSHKLKKSQMTRKSDVIEGAEVLRSEETGELIYKCNVCQRIVKRRAQMQQHVLIHRPERDVCCHDCGAMFKTPSCLYSHRKIHKERRKLTCDVCGKAFEQKYYLTEHMNAIHLNLKKHTCPICGISFARKASLIKHGDVHRSNSERRIVCEVCGFRSHTKPDMSRHMKTHTGEKNHACEICEKRFACRYNVSAHIKAVHQGIKPKIDESKLRCMLCGKRYPRQKQLRKHLFDAHRMEEYAAEFTGDKN